MTRSDDRRPPATEARIDELEARLAQQDQSVLELSDELYRQQRQIAQLTEELRAVRARFDALASREPPPGSTDELPPHY
jgi:uncharacterized coiled-coil protein SlyX